MQIFVFQTLFAQITVENEEFTFRVVIEQGDIFEITKSGKKIPLMSGEFLSKKAVISLEKNSYLILADSKGKMKEFSGEVLLSIDNLTKNWENKQPKNLVMLQLISQMIAANKIDTSKNNERLAYLERTPVYRCLSSSGGMIYMPQNKEFKRQIIQTNLFIKIYPNELAKAEFKHLHSETKYIITATNFSNKLLFTKEVPITDFKNFETTLEIEMKPYISMMKYESNFILYISTKEEKERLQDDQLFAFRIVEKPAVIPVLHSSTQKALEYVQTAYYYQENGFSYDAFVYLEKALALKPDVVAFQVLYYDFIINNKMRYFPKDGINYYPTLLPTENKFLKPKYQR